MKRLQRMISALLCIALLCGTVTFGVSALQADEQWRSYFADYMQTGGGVYMAPGANESERNISWYAPAGTDECCVRVSRRASLSSPRVFYGECIKTQEGDMRCKVTVRELSADTTYYYRCVTDTWESSVFTFSTAADSGFTAMYVTDIHVSKEDDENSLVNQSYTFSKVLEEANAVKPLDLIISAGDQATKGYRSEYTALTAAPLVPSVPFALCPGNHDRKGIAYKYFTNNPNEFSKGVTHSLIAYDYWYVKGDALFLVFDSNVASMTGHRRFVQDAVKQNPNVKWRIATFHHDLYGGRIPHREEENELLRKIWGPIIDEFRFDLVLLGHSHYFTVSNAIFGNATNEALDMSDGAVVTDPKGAIVMVSGSINHPRIIDEDAEEPPVGENIAYYTYKDYAPIYNLLDFSADSITVRSYTLGKRTPFHTFTIAKTSPEGGHPEAGGRFVNFWLRLIADIYGWFNEAVTTVKLVWNRKQFVGK